MQTTLFSIYLEKEHRELLEEFLPKSFDVFHFSSFFDVLKKYDQKKPVAIITNFYDQDRVSFADYFLRYHLPNQSPFILWSSLYASFVQEELNWELVMQHLPQGYRLKWIQDQTVEPGTLYFYTPDGNFCGEINCFSKPESIGGIKKIIARSSPKFVTHPMRQERVLLFSTDLEWLVKRKAQLENKQIKVDSCSSLQELPLLCRQTSPQYIVLQDDVETPRPVFEKILQPAQKFEILSDTVFSRHITSLENKEKPQIQNYNSSH